LGSDFYISDPTIGTENKLAVRVLKAGGQFLNVTSELHCSFHPAKDYEECDRETYEKSGQS